jgi:hypothetical protein
MGKIDHGQVVTTKFERFVVRADASIEHIQSMIAVYDELVSIHVDGVRIL